MPTKSQVSNDESSDNGNKVPNWLKFEQEVAKIFELFGYDEVTHDTKIESGQCDVLAKSKKRNKPNILAECKYHRSPTHKVNIVEVQNFISKASNYRMSGKIDQGYLVTNTGFTSDARGAISENVGNYIFLLTYDELIQNLLDINRYLQEYISEYDNREEGDKYVEMKLINTTSLDYTILDSSPGTLISNKNGKQNYLVIPQSSVDIEREPVTYLDYSSDLFNPSIKPKLFIQEIKEYYIRRQKALKDFNSRLIECMIDAINRVATETKDDLLYDLLQVLPDDSLKTISWAPEIVVTTLLDKWQEFNGDIHLKTLRKTDYRKNIQRNILKNFRSASQFIFLNQIEAPSILTYTGHILNALKLEPGLTKNLIKDYSLDETLWTVENEFDNFIKHLEQNADKTPQLKFLFEEGALPALENYINSDLISTLVIIGDYGAGKTTILRKLMRILSANKLAKQNNPNVRIPLYITLKDYNKVPDIQTLIRLFLQNVVEIDNVSIRTFKKLNEEGRFVLLLDAYDEMLTRVTKADRRRCFTEISELVSKNSKIILTGRPAYFNDYKELKKNLESLRKRFVYNKTEINSEYEVMCLQLLDEDQVEQLIVKASGINSKNVLNILLNRPNLMDLARRPVLASMIAQTGTELIKLENQKISARNIYEIYTNKWVQREEDKGSFRLLIHAEQKSTFLRYLAMQMHLSGLLTIHFTELDKSVEQYFKLDTIEEVDHFSHDIRTCSFLSRTDDGYYFFIHKSFMEYFVACEFEYGETSPFVDKFSNDLTSEIIDLLDLDKLPTIIKMLWTNRGNLESCIEAIKIEKSKAVKKQDFDLAPFLRDIEKVCMEILEKYNSAFTMKYNSETNLLNQLKSDLKRVFSRQEQFSKKEVDQIKNVLTTHLKEFNLDL